MSVGYRDYAHATLDIINTFQWRKIALVFDGEASLFRYFMLIVLFNNCL